MLKIIYIPTGNIFVMPDKEALRLARTESYNYKILDAGLQEEKEEKVSKETIKDLVLKSEKRAEEIEEEDKEEVQEAVYETELDFDKFTKADLVGAVRAAGLKVDAKRTTKAKLIEMAKEAGIKP